MCVCKRERMQVCVREDASVNVCVCVCVRERMRVNVCVCVCERERGCV